MGDDGDKATEDVGHTPSRSGEDIQDKEGKEGGRQDTGDEGATDRPTGTSTARDYTGIDPQDPIGDEGPDESKGGGSSN